RFAALQQRRPRVDPQAPAGLLAPVTGEAHPRQGGPDAQLEARLGVLPRRLAPRRPGRPDEPHRQPQQDHDPPPPGGLPVARARASVPLGATGVYSTPAAARNATRGSHTASTRPVPRRRGRVASRLRASAAKCWTFRPLGPRAIPATRGAVPR